MLPPHFPSAQCAPMTLVPGIFPTHTLLLVIVAVGRSWSGIQQKWISRPSWPCETSPSAKIKDRVRVMVL